MEPMEPMRVLPVYSYWPIVLNRFDLLHYLLLAPLVLPYTPTLSLLLDAFSSVDPLATMCLTRKI